MNTNNKMKKYNNKVLSNNEEVECCINKIKTSDKNKLKNSRSVKCNKKRDSISYEMQKQSSSTSKNNILQVNTDNVDYMKDKQNNTEINDEVNKSIPKKQLQSLEDSLQYNFNNKEILRNALMHSSIKKSAIPFERLEFLGDRILGVVIAEYIYRKTTGNEGEMAKMHSAFVCAESCYEVAIKLGVNNIIKTAGPALRNNKTVLADAMEAILGAIFTDSKRDYKIVENIVIRLWKPIFKKYKEEDQEPKTQLQEIVQASTNEVPLYTLLSETGPKHHPVFTVSVTALGNTIQASGFSKKEAETKAAKELLRKIHSE